MNKDKTSRDAFRTVLTAFLTDLLSGFNLSTPDRLKLKAAQNAWITLQPDEKALSKRFLSITNPLFELIRTKDSSLFTSGLLGELPYVGGINWAQYYNESSEKTQHVIWRYLNTLHTISFSMMDITPEVTESIELIAKEYASKLPSNLDPNDARKQLDSLLDIDHKRLFSLGNGEMIPDDLQFLYNALIKVGHPQIPKVINGKVER
jgi:hypothetical protein